jgi:hypothetical protein
VGLKDGSSVGSVDGSIVETTDGSMVKKVDESNEGLMAGLLSREVVDGEAAEVGS